MTSEEAPMPAPVRRLSNHRPDRAVHVMRTFPHLSDEPNAFGYYEIRWSENQGGGWRSKRKSTKTGSRDKAEAALARFLTVRNADDDFDDKTVADVFEAYIYMHSRRRGNEKSDRQNMRAPLAAFGKTAAVAVRDQDVDAYARRRAAGSHGERAVKPATIRRELTALQAVLNFGSRKGMIRSKPTYRFEKPSDGQGRDTWLTEQQEREIIARLPDAPLGVRLFTKMGLAYGARKGVLLDLRFGPQVDFITGKIDFNPPDKVVSRKRRPVVPMTVGIRADLEEAFLIRGRGKRVCGMRSASAFDTFMRDIGYGWVTPHVMKHTAITLMLRRGIAIETVAKLTATDPRTILRVYRHHTMDELLSVVDQRGF